MTVTVRGCSSTILVHGNTVCTSSYIMDARCAPLEPGSEHPAQNACGHCGQNDHEQMLEMPYSFASDLPANMRQNLLRCAEPKGPQRGESVVLVLRGRRSLHLRATVPMRIICLPRCRAATTRGSHPTSNWCR